MSPLPPPSMGAQLSLVLGPSLQWPLLSLGGQNAEKRTSFLAVSCLPPNPWEPHYAASTTLVHCKEPPADAGTRSLVLRCLRHPDACNSLAGRPTPTFHQPLLGFSSDPRDLILLILTINNLHSVLPFFYPLLGYANLSDSGDVCYNPQEWGGAGGSWGSPVPSPLPITGLASGGSEQPHLFRFPPLLPTSPFGEPGPGLQLVYVWGSFRGRLGGGQVQAGLAGQSCDSWAWRIPPPLPARLPHKAPIVQENHAIVSCLYPPQSRGAPPILQTAPWA